MLSAALALFTFCLLGVEGVHAIRVPLEARTIPYHQLPAPYRHRLHPRANTTVVVKSAQNTQYLANITIGGGAFSVILDTGSSDLWVTGNIPTKQELDKTATVKYAVGSATGEISSAKVDFSGYSVPDQAFIYVQDASSTGLDTSHFSGLLGLGPSASSVVRQTVNQASGDPFLDRVFRQNTSTPNFITLLLDRSGDPGEPFAGQLTIGEVVPGFEKITSQPKIAVKALPSPLKVDQHWSGTLDGIIGPDGQNIGLDSLVPGTDSGKLVAIFDSGFTLPQVPRDVSDAIYGRVPGANYDTSNGWWAIPCDQEVNLTVVIAGQNYPIHPLDTSSGDLNYTDATTGKGACVGAFQPMSTALDGTFDAVMGMGFLRNTYTYINFGDFVEGNPSNTGDPYMQLLAVTDAGDAHKDFVKIRLNGTDTTGDSAHALLPASQEKHSPVSDSEKAKNAFFRYWPWLVAGLGLIIVVGVAYLVFRCCCGGRGRAKGGFGTGPYKQGGFKVGPYRPLQDPAPAPAMDLHAMGPPPHGGAYADPYYQR